MAGGAGAGGLGLVYPDGGAEGADKEELDGRAVGKREPLELSVGEEEGAADALANAEDD